LRDPAQDEAVMNGAPLVCGHDRATRRTPDVVMIGPPAAHCKHGVGSAAGGSLQTRCI